VGDSTFLSKACPATVSEAACSSQDIPAEAEDNLVVVPKPITDANSELQITLCQINVANVDPSLDTTPVIVPPETDAHLEMKRMRFSDRLCFFCVPVLAPSPTAVYYNLLHPLFMKRRVQSLILLMCWV